MKIQTISCGQFAGIQDCSIDLKDGINVVYGKNESGKSTLVNLLSRTLFQSAKLDGRRDKDFLEKYFPSGKRGGIAGDYIDGTVVLENEKGRYTLSKEWGTDPRCTLSTPEGKFRDQKEIARKLSEVLEYGEGIYGELLLSGQNGSSYALESLLDAANNKMAAKKELTDIVTTVFSESDGISIDAIDQAIQDKIGRIEGKHWDVERGSPVRKAGRWSNGCGEILTAYYALEDAKAVNERISQLEKDVDAAAEAYRKCTDAVQRAESMRDRFQSFSNQLILKAERQKTISRLTEDQKKYSAIIHNWPETCAALETAQRLKTEKADRMALDQYTIAKKAVDTLAGMEALLIRTPCPEKAEIANVKRAQKQLDILKNKLCGMNLAAAVRMLGGNSIEIRSVRTGEKVDITDEKCTITEAVNITVPGVMELQLAPANVDVASVEQKQGEYRARIDEVFKKYGVSAVEELEAMAERYTAQERDVEKQRMVLEKCLGMNSLDALQSAAQAANAHARPIEEIEADIHRMCGSMELSRFIAGKEAVLDNYKREYTSVETLKAQAFDGMLELQKAQASILSDTDIPAEYRSIEDPERYLADQQSKVSDAQRRKQEAYGEKAAAVQELETYKEGLIGDPMENEENARRIFEEQKELLDHWIHIRQVFLAQKEALSANPMQDIADRFAYYLGVISGGRVASEFPEMDKLNMCIYSADRLVDYGKLSEGTKNTVSLAFRLATLDHLFPDGGGVIVFDDPFTDMDSERTEHACRLVQECAKRHQVIFLTCKEEYLDRLQGNVIRIGESENGETPGVL